MIDQLTIYVNEQTYNFMQRDQCVCVRVCVCVNHLIELGINSVSAGINR